MPDSFDFEIDRVVSTIARRKCTSVLLQFGTAGSFGSTLFELDDLKFTTPSTPPPTPMPEPGTLALFLTGLIGLGLLSRRRRKPMA